MTINHSGFQRAQTQQDVQIRHPSRKLHRQAGLLGVDECPDRRFGIIHSAVFAAALLHRGSTGAATGSGRATCCNSAAHEQRLVGGWCLLRRQQSAQIQTKGQVQRHGGIHRQRSLAPRVRHVRDEIGHALAQRALQRATQQRDQIHRQGHTQAFANEAEIQINSQNRGLGIECEPDRRVAEHAAQSSLQALQRHLLAGIQLVQRADETAAEIQQIQQVESENRQVGGQEPKVLRQAIGHRLQHVGHCRQDIDDLAGIETFQQGMVEIAGPIGCLGCRRIRLRCHREGVGDQGRTRPFDWRRRCPRRGLVRAEGIRDRRQRQLSRRWFVTRGLLR